MNPLGHQRAHNTINQAWSPHRNLPEKHELVIMASQGDVEVKPLLHRRHNLVTNSVLGRQALSEHPRVVVMVNGPEDVALDWHALGWRAAEDDIRRLRQRIFTVSQAGDLKRVRI